MTTQVALHVSRISDSSAFGLPSGHASFLTNAGQQGCDESFPSFVSNRPASACVFGRKVNEGAEVVVKDRDETKFPLPVFYPKKIARDRKPQPARPTHKSIQSTAKKPRPQPPKPKAKTLVPAPTQSVKNFQKATPPAPFKRPTVPKLPPHPRPASTISSKSADKISATEMMRYLEDVPKILEPEAGDNPVQPLVDEIIKESLRKQREAKDQRKREQSAAMEERQRRREEIAENNIRIREINRARFKARKTEKELPWGADQRRILGIAELQFQKEAQILREKRRTERAKSAGRSRLGLEILDILNHRSSPPKRSTSAEESNNSRNYSHYDVEEIQLYMRRQREMIREEQETEALRIKAEEEKRLSQLEDLEEIQKYRLAHFKRSKRRKPSKRKSKKKLPKSLKIPSHSDSVAPEDSEVSQIMYQPHESSSLLLMDREGRSCSLFGNIAVSEDVGNSTKLVASIVDKHGIAEKTELPKALNTAPVKEALDSSRGELKPSRDLNRDREDMDSSRSFEYEDQRSDPGLAEDASEELLFHAESDEHSHQDLLRRKEDVRRRLAELRNRMEEPPKDDESSSRYSDRPLPSKEKKSPPVVQHQELRKMLQRDAAIKIQAHIRRFLAQRRVMRMLDELEEFEEDEEEAPVLLHSRKPFTPPKSRPSPIHVPIYEADPKPSPPSLHSSNHLSETEFQARLRQEQLHFTQLKEQEIEQLRQENRKLLEEQQRKLQPGKQEEGYLQQLNSAKEQDIQQFQELMQTKCGSRVDLIEEMSMAFENMLEVRYRELAFMFSQNREGIQAAMGSAPSEMNISSDLAHTNVPKEAEEAKTREIPPDSGLYSFLDKVLGTQESHEIEKLAQEKFAEIAKKAEEQAESEDQSFDPYSARPENPFPDEDSESGSSLHSYDERLQSPNMSEIKKEEEEKGSPMKKKRVTDAFTKPLQLQLVTGEAQDSSSRSLSRSGKFRYFKEEMEDKELIHVPSPDPATILRPNPMEAPFRIQQAEIRDSDEPSKPQMPAQVSKHFLEDIDSSGSFQEDVDDYSSVDDGNSQRVQRLEGRQEEGKIVTAERKKIDERDKNAIFEALYRPFFDRAVAESLRLSGVRIVPVTILQPAVPFSSPEPVKIPSQPSDLSPVPPKPSKPSPPPTEITEIRLFDQPDRPISHPSEADKTTALVEDITLEILRKLLMESVPRPEERAMPELPPLNFQHLEEGKAKEIAQKSKADAPEKTNPKVIQDYLRSVFLKAANADFSKTIGTPISFDPVDILGELQDIEQGPLITYDIKSKAIIPTEVFLELDEGGEGGSSRREMTPSTKDIIRDSKRFHNRLVFDAANEALQKYRPYGLKGAPLPWSTNVRALAPPQPNLAAIQDKVLAEVAEWSTFEVGKIPEGEIILSSGQVDEEQLQQIREERLSKMLTQEILENDQVWVDYEAEEAQVKIDIADMILEQIMAEIEDFLHGLNIQN